MDTTKVYPTQSAGDSTNWNVGEVKVTARFNENHNNNSDKYYLYHALTCKAF